MKTRRLTNFEDTNVVVGKGIAWNSNDTKTKFPSIYELMIHASYEDQLETY